MTIRVRLHYYGLVEASASLSLLTYPMLMLGVKGGMNGVFLVMLLIALLALIVRPAGLEAVRWRGEWTIYSAAMLAMVVAIFISQTFHQNYSGHPYDAASRYWLAIPIFLLLQRLRWETFTVLQYAFPIAAITGFLLAYDDGAGRWRIATLNPIPYGDFEMTLGMLSLFSINWFGRDQIYLRILKLLGFVAGLAASFASGSRGGWLLLPVLFAIFIYFKMGKISFRILSFILVSTIFVSALLYSFSSSLQHRVNALVTDIRTLDQDNNRINIVQNRLRLYRAAMNTFMNHPIVGVGPEGFAQEIQAMFEAGEVSQYDAEMGRGEVHNDILSKAAGMGIFGLVAILAIYFVPLRLFWQATKSAVFQARQSGVLGIAFVSGFFVFGLTVEILNLTMATAFYSFTVAVLLAVCYNVHNDLPSASLNLKANKIDI